LQSLFATNTGAVDLFALVNQIKSPRGESPNLMRPDESTMNDVRLAAASKLALLGVQTIDVRNLDNDVAQRIDLLPELTSLSFSYYDGQQWSSSWSFSRRGHLPVAVEMRFDLAKSNPTNEPPDSDPSVAAQQVLRDRNIAPVALESPMDDRLQSSQTAAPVGYRWLIYLGGQEAGELGQLEQEVVAPGDSES
jgi:hypothetical protein